MRIQEMIGFPIEVTHEVTDTLTVRDACGDILFERTVEAMTLRDREIMDYVVQAINSYAKTNGDDNT